MSFSPENKAQYFCPAVTLFDSQGKIDYDSCFKHYDHLIENGVDGIAVPGSMGEFYNLSLQDAKTLITKAFQHINGRTKVIVGAGRLLPSEAVDLCNLAAEKGAFAVLLVSPFYQALSQDEIIDFYGYVATNSPVNIILYNIPSKTGYDINPQTMLTLRRKYKNIWGVKDTLPGMDHTRQIIQLVKKEFPDFRVFSGVDDNFSHNLTSGGNGCIGGLSNVFPNITSGFVKAWNTGDWPGVIEYQRKIDSLMPFYDICPSIISVVKAALLAKGIIACDKALCTSPATPEQRERIAAVLKAEGLLK